MASPTARRSVSPPGNSFDMAAMQQLWDAALSRFKAYVEAAELGEQPAADAIQDWPPLIPAQ